MSGIFLWIGLTCIVALPHLFTGLPWTLLGAILMLVGCVLLVIGR